MSIGVILVLVWMHFIADFVLQTDWMAKNKSSSNVALTIHVVLYSIPFIWFGWVYAIVNGMLHFATDYVTSRVTSHFWKTEQRHLFFVVIGADQALHMTALFATYMWLF